MRQHPKRGSATVPPKTEEPAIDRGIATTSLRTGLAMTGGRGWEADVAIPRYRAPSANPAPPPHHVRPPLSKQQKKHAVIARRRSRRGNPPRHPHHVRPPLSNDQKQRCHCEEAKPTWQSPQVSAPRPTRQHPKRGSATVPPKTEREAFNRGIATPVLRHWFAMTDRRKSAADVAIPPASGPRPITFEQQQKTTLSLRGGEADVAIPPGIRTTSDAATPPNAAA